MNRPDMPEGIIPIGDTPDGYSPEYLPDGQVWLLHNGERIRLLRDHSEFAIAAQMAGGYATLRQLRDWNVPLVTAPFRWRGRAPQYPVPSKPPTSYGLLFNFSWPMITVTVPLETAIWRLWRIVEETKKHEWLIRQFDPVSSWFEGWINPRMIFEGPSGAKHIRLRDLRSEESRLYRLIKAT